MKELFNTLSNVSNFFQEEYLIYYGNKGKAKTTAESEWIDPFAEVPTKKPAPKPKVTALGAQALKKVNARTQKLALTPADQYLEKMGNGQMKVKFPNEKAWRETRLDQVADGKPLNFTPGPNNKSHSRMKGKPQRVVKIAGKYFFADSFRKGKMPKKVRVYNDDIFSQCSTEQCQEIQQESTDAGKLKILRSAQRRAKEAQKRRDNMKLNALLIELRKRKAGPKAIFAAKAAHTMPSAKREIPQIVREELTTNIKHVDNPKMWEEIHDVLMVRDPKYAATFKKAYPILKDAHVKANERYQKHKGVLTAYLKQEYKDISKPDQVKIVARMMLQPSKYNITSKKGRIAIRQIVQQSTGLSGLINKGVKYVANKIEEVREQSKAYTIKIETRRAELKKGHASEEALLAYDLVLNSHNPDKIIALEKKHGTNLNTKTPLSVWQKLGFTWLMKSDSFERKFYKRHPELNVDLQQINKATTTAKQALGVKDIKIQGEYDSERMVNITKDLEGSVAIISNKVKPQLKGVTIIIDTNSNSHDVKVDKAKKTMTINPSENVPLHVAHMANLIQTGLEKMA